MKRLTIDAPLALAIALGATSPSASTGALVYSTTTACQLQFDGTRWVVPKSEGVMILQSKSAAYTFDFLDIGTAILHPTSDTTARTFTIDSNANKALPVGATITVINQHGAGVVTLAITTDTMYLAGVGVKTTIALAANGMMTLVKLSSTEWMISGVGTS